MINKPWDYLIVTASNKEQARVYHRQLAIRKELGFLPQVKEVLAVADPGGKRVGSGGSTIFCLLQVLNRELPDSPERVLDPAAWLETFSRRRILIVHAGGDSRRLPSYGPCGKIFIPLPGEPDRVLGMTLFDRLLPAYLSLPPGPGERGHVVVTTGDVLLTFDAGKVSFLEEGITGLGCYAAPELTKNHGVFCQDRSGKVRLFLQKPSLPEQTERRGIDRHGRSILDIGIMNLDAPTAVRLIQMCEIQNDSSGELSWTGDLGEAIEESGLDFYREICCAMGTEANLGDYLQSVRRSGSKLGEAHLRRIFETMSRVPFSVCILPQCGFLHFGTSRQLIHSGNDLLNMDYGTSHSSSCLDINNDVSREGRICGANSWVEGCRIRSTLTLGGENVVTGIEVDSPLSIPPRSVIDVLRGRDRKGNEVWFVRSYGIDDTFNQPISEEARLANLPLAQWLRSLEAAPEDLWGPELAPTERQIWQARIFPGVSGPQDFRDWLWMLQPGKATSEQKRAWKAAERFSFSEMASLASLDDFFFTRFRNRLEEMRRSLRRLFRHQSGFSAAELSFIFRNLNPEGSSAWIAEIIKEACLRYGNQNQVAGIERLELSRILHTAGSAIQDLTREGSGAWKSVLPGVYEQLGEREIEWLGSLGLEFTSSRDGLAWAQALRESAFRNVGRTIVMSRETHPAYPKNALRTDEIIWGRAPARLDLGGGWSDTPPYSLENGGCVINAAVNLNGQPPIHAYARVIGEPEIRIASIDHGAHLTIREMDELLDYRMATSKFALAKAALALAGFSPEAAHWPRGVNTLEQRMKLFGGGIELTTLAAIPSGSGLGTSSIMGAVLMAVVYRLIGRDLSPRQLFHNVLRLEQELTTGGGWQDQIGGAVGGVKMITTDAGMVPDPRIHFVQPDVLSPRMNNAQTLLYYTGITRLAKDILRHVVGNYLDRDRASMETLRRLHAFPPLMAEVMASKDIRHFGELIDVAWNLNKQIDPDSTTEAIEEILDETRPHIYGAKLLGAGGGGFLLMVCRTPEDTRAARARLLKNPPNDRARFFDFEISSEGLVVTVC